MKAVDKKKYEFSTEEGNCLFDAESFGEYDHTDPGTITVSGFAIEAWEHQELNHHIDQTILSSREARNISGKTILRRLYDMANRGEKLGWNKERDAHDLADFMREST